MPLADIQGSTSGPTLLVTAGLDGDEYPSIAAVFEAAERYADGEFAGRLIILPIINIAGFDAGTSENPIDGKYPKYCIPGSLFGTSSERLMRRVVQTYARHADVWLDLHSAAQNETVIPCLWNDITGKTRVDERGKAFTKISGVIAAVHEPAGNAAHALATYGCTYVLAESEDEEQHGTYIERAMQVLGMISGAASAQPPRIFTKTRDLETLSEESEAGEIILWKKIRQPNSRNERLGEIAYGEITE